MRGTVFSLSVVFSVSGVFPVSVVFLYLAVLRAELEVIERYNHSMTINYVPAAMDAAIAACGVRAGLDVVLMVRGKGRRTAVDARPRPSMTSSGRAR